MTMVAVVGVAMCGGANGAVVLESPRGGRLPVQGPKHPDPRTDLPVLPQFPASD